MHNERMNYFILFKNIERRLYKYNNENGMKSILYCDSEDY